MKNKERFDRTIKILVEAFFSGTLAKENCAACAVGNIVGHALGIDKGEIKKSIELEIPAYMLDNSRWSDVFCTNGGLQEIDASQYSGFAKKIIDSTGYTWRELAMVEKAFERNSEIGFRQYRSHTKQEIMEDQYNGLMAVVDVLCKIEGIESESYKKMFDYTEEFKPVSVF